MVNKVGIAIRTVYNAIERMTGSHDYRNVSVYKNWDGYLETTEGKGRLLPYKR